MPETLDLTLSAEQATILSPEERRRSRDLFASLKSGRERPSRYWKIDLDKLDFDALQHSVESSVARISGGTGRGVITCDLETAQREHPNLFNEAFGKALATAPAKFAHLTRAFVSGGAFIYIPTDVAVSEPITITYRPSSGMAFPYTLVLTGQGAHCTIVEEIASEQSGVAVCGVAEILPGPNAHVTYASVQLLPDDAQVFFTRVALPRQNVTVAWAAAELGAHLSASSIDITIEEPGVNAQITGIFFPKGDQHVDMISTMDHRVGLAQSQTLIKSAATGAGQARYLGNIRILPNAHGTDASLRDDALLLSKHAHIDSVPALEIAANDVKAFHGATVGSIDEEQIFYMMSRGLNRRAAERMIALGFFEPAVDRFPGEALRARLHSTLEAKVLAE